jgi:hypothetical protein
MRLIMHLPAAMRHNRELGTQETGLSNSAGCVCGGG